jgi:hypothetical protein
MVYSIERENIGNLRNVTIRSTRQEYSKDVDPMYRKLHLYYTRVFYWKVEFFLWLNILLVLRYFGTGGSIKADKIV